MTKKYVWWDEIQRLETSRIDLRVPKPLHEFLREVATKHGVPLNSLVVGILTYAADADAHARLRVEVMPAVRVTETKPDRTPVEVPALDATPAARKRWRIPKVREYRSG